MSSLPSKEFDIRSSLAIYNLVYAPLYIYIYVYIHKRGGVCREHIYGHRLQVQDVVLLAHPTAFPAQMLDSLQTVQIKCPGH